jgi:branched-chain amino acid transport system substrate-binding protein
MLMDLQEFIAEGPLAINQRRIPTIDSQILQLRASSPDALISGTTAKFTAQAIRKIAEVGWKTRHYITGGSSSYAGTIGPAGPENAVGVISSAYLKDVNYPAWKDDSAIKEGSSPFRGVT